MYECPKPDPRSPKQPHPLKRTPLKKGKITIIKHFTPERAKLEKAKIDTYRSLDRPPFCQGCGTREFEHSHRITQGNREHIANPKNIDRFCRSCHVKYESGYLWQLDNGAEIAEWLREADFEFYRRKCYKMKDRIEEGGVKPENLPGWVQEILNEIS